MYIVFINIYTLYIYIYKHTCIYLQLSHHLTTDSYVLGVTPWWGWLNHQMLGPLSRWGCWKRRCRPLFDLIITSNTIGWNRMVGWATKHVFVCSFLWPLFRWLKAKKWAKLDCWRRSKAVGLGVHATGSTASHCTYQLEDASSVWCCCVVLSYCWCMSMVFKIEPWTHAFHLKISTWLTSL